MDNFFKNWFQKREVTPAASAPDVPSTTDPNHSTNQEKVMSGDYSERIAYVRGPEQALVVAAV